MLSCRQRFPLVRLAANIEVAACELQRVQTYLLIAHSCLLIQTARDATTAGMPSRHLMASVAQEAIYRHTKAFQGEKQQRVEEAQEQEIRMLRQVLAPELSSQ